ncbi:MAG: acyl-CoA dehydrogenase-like protein [Caulobacter sp.]|nr:acyl-CoA dehydrogenase-like protein [Caulobacter sp.]
MNLDYSDADRAYRDKARAWLADNKPKEERPPEGDPAAAFDLAWQKRQYEGGLAGPNWPKEYGGLGLTAVQQLIWYEETVRAKAPSFGMLLIALTHAGPTLIAGGTEAQKAFHLPKILKGEVVWCQGFSEPNAGSDLAAVRTCGEVDGEHLVVTGQKTWTSAARQSRYQELLVRTEPGSERHKGLTWVICDMTTPGIEVVPIRTMFGESEINATFYDEVRIPLTNVVGEVGGGWAVAMSTLAFERGTSFLRDQLSLADKVERVIALARTERLVDGTIAFSDPEIAHALGELKADAMALRAMAVSNVARVDRMGSPGPEGSMIKLLVTQAERRLNDLVGKILGPRFLDYGENRAGNQWTFEYLWGWVLTIAGGTSEIQKEIIADRVLELPRSR